jgi:hypothetical protein
MSCPRCHAPAGAANAYCQACGAQIHAAGAAGPNTSGLGPNSPAPSFARGWTFAGFAPLGLFAFVHGSALWGVLYFLIFPVYAIYIGIQGKELAWRSRRFESEMQYAETMRAWNLWGIIFLVLDLLVFGLGFTLLVGLAVATRPQGLF